MFHFCVYPDMIKVVAKYPTQIDLPYCALRDGMHDNLGIMFGQKFKVFNGLNSCV